MNRLLAFFAALLLVAPLSAKEPTMPDKSTLAAPLFTTITGNPLRINVGADNSYQVFNADVTGAGQIYPTTATQTADMGWFVRVGNALYAPNFGEHPGGTATGSLGGTVPFRGFALSSLVGNGTSLTPYRVRVNGAVGSTGLTALKSVQYVNGQNYFTQRFRLLNNGPSPIQATIYLGSDIYLAASDAGVPFREPTSGAPGGQDCGAVPSYTILHIPLTPANRFTAVGYDSVWQQIGAGTLNNTVGTGCIDNGAALQWNVTVPEMGSASVFVATSFGTIPPITTFNVNDVNPSQSLPDRVLQVTISGNGFVPGTTFSFGGGITVSNLTIVNPTTATATLSIAANAEFGFRDVVGTQTPGGQVATLYDGFAVTLPPVWNYSVDPDSVSASALRCIRDSERFPANPETNLDGWSPGEGEFYQANPGGVGQIVVPTLLARAILECYVGQWVTPAGALHPAWCWQDPTPWYTGAFEGTRRAQFRIYPSTNGDCGEIPPGAQVFEGNVFLQRELFFPMPLMSAGFEPR